jgi:DNA-binding transcriptional regulator GbsR (MarR family)
LLKMRTNFEIPELLVILKSSKKPLSADQIAKKAGTMRNRVNPFLKKMVTAGQVVEVREGDQPTLFMISESAANELITPITRKPRKPAAKSATKPAAKTPKATTATSGQKPGRKPAAKVESNVHQLQRPADKTTATTVAPGTSANVTPIKAPTAEVGDLKLALLRMLVDRDLRKVDLQDALGPIDDILEELKKDQLIEQQHIIDSYVYSLTDKAFVVYPELKDKPAPVPAPVAPVAAVAEPQKPAEAPAPATKPATKPAAKKPAAVASAPAAQAPAAPALPPVLGEISQEISRVVEQIFKDRMEGLVEELRVKSEEQEANRKAIAEVSQGIQVCTKAFQTAIDALSGLAEMLKKIN